MVIREGKCICINLMYNDKFYKNIIYKYEIIKPPMGSSIHYEVYFEIDTRALFDNYNDFNKYFKDYSEYRNDLINDILKD